MKELEQKADFVIDIYRTYIRKADVSYILRVEDERFLATKCAIQSINHTIALLERMDKEIYNIEPYLDEQIELKKILEGRLHL